jgi:hypothetical protein
LSAAASLLPVLRGAEVGTHTLMPSKLPLLKDSTKKLLVLGIRIRMFLDLPDPDPLVRGTDPSLFS